MLYVEPLYTRQDTSSALRRLMLAGERKPGSAAGSSETERTIEQRAERTTKGCAERTIKPKKELGTQRSPYGPCDPLKRGEGIT